MNESVPSRPVVRFGVFEVDLASGELRKGGLKIRLSGQPFQILVMLLERPGEVVTREELQKKLWPNGTFVYFDHSLNTAINKIREALGDSAEGPRFVETLARRGYRFIALLESIGPGIAAAKWGPAPSEQLNLSTDGQVASSSAHLELSESAQAVRLPPPRAKRRVATFVSIGLLLAVAAAAAFWWSTRRVAETPGLLKLTRLTSDSGLTTDAVISPDGKLLAYASDRSGEGDLDIWVKQVAGGEPLRLTRHSADDHQPAFSPDGSQIGFRSEREAGGLYLISTLGGGERLLVPFGRNPQFSPEGNWIAYWAGSVRGWPLGALPAGGELFVVPATVGPSQRVNTGFASAG